MSEKDFNLEELKTQYSLVEEGLDDKEIVSDDRIRETIYSKFAVIRSDTKDGLLWSNLLIVPFFAWYFAPQLPSWMLWAIAVYWLASLLFKLFLLRRTRKEEYGSFDLKTLTEKDADYIRKTKAANIVSGLFWAGILLYYLISSGKAGVIFMAAILIGVCIRELVIKLRYNGQNIDPETGKPRVLNPKGAIIVLGCIMAIAICCMTSDFIITAIVGKDITDLLLDVIGKLSVLFAAAAFFLAILFSKTKAKVSAKLINTLIAISLALFAVLAVVALLTGNIAVIHMYSLIAVGFCAIAHSYIRMKKNRKK